MKLFIQNWRSASICPSFFGTKWINKIIPRPKIFLSITSVRQKLSGIQVMSITKTLKQNRWFGTIWLRNVTAPVSTKYITQQMWHQLKYEQQFAALDVRRRWTGLREKYRREKIYNTRMRRNGTPAEPHRWPSFDKMAFLDQVYVPRGWVTDCMSTGQWSICS